MFDTDIFVSAFVFPGSRADAAIRRVLDGVDELVISRPITDELLTVLARKFARNVEQSGIGDEGTVGDLEARPALLNSPAADPGLRGTSE